MPFQDVVLGVELDRGVVAQPAAEIVADGEPEQQRVVDVEVVDLAVVDIVVVAEIAPGDAEPEVLVGQEVGAQAEAADLDEGLGVEEVARAQVPDRYQAVIVRALIVRRHRDAGADGKTARRGGRRGALGGAVDARGQLDWQPPASPRPEPRQ